MITGNEDVRELARAHVADLVSRPGLRRIVELALDAADGNSDSTNAHHPRPGSDDRHHARRSPQ